MNKTSEEIKNRIEDLLVNTDHPVFSIYNWGYVDGRIVGTVSERPPLEQGEIMMTNVVIGRLNDVVLTKSGNLYRLSKPFGTNKLEDVK